MILTWRCSIQGASGLPGGLSPPPRLPASASWGSDITPPHCSGLMPGHLESHYAVDFRFGILWTLWIKETFKDGHVHLKAEDTKLGSKGGMLFWKLKMPKVRMGYPRREPLLLKALELNLVPFIGVQRVPKSQAGMHHAAFLASSPSDLTSFSGGAGFPGPPHVTHMHR